MSYDRMKKDVARLTKEIEQLLARAEEVDGDEQARFGDGRVADIPAEIARRRERKAKIEAAMAALEEEARAARANELQEQAERHEQKAADEALDKADRKRAATLAAKRRAALERLQAGTRASGDDDNDDSQAGGDLPEHQVPHTPDGMPKGSAQRNFTDPESRIMVRDGDHFVQAFNAQAVVDNENQIVVSAGVSNQAPDVEYLPPMLERVNANLAAAEVARPAKVPLAADAGFFSEANVAAAEALGFDPHIAVDRIRRTRPELAPVGATGPAPGEATGPPPATAPGEATGPPATAQAEATGPPTAKDAMRAKLQTEEGARIYGLRKTTPEPVFGQILEVRGFRRFLLRGLEKVNGEWNLVTLTHNVLKLFRSGRSLPAVA
jgi:hypothetical protein